MASYSLRIYPKQPTNRRFLRVLLLDAVDEWGSPIFPIRQAGGPPRQMSILPLLPLQVLLPQQWEGNIQPR